MPPDIDFDPFPDQLKKFCVFCGKKPDNKNREHIIPQWLIKMTGNPHRKARVALIKETASHRQHSWLAFAFPACTDCNTKHSEMEGVAKTVVTALLNNEPIFEDDFSTFMDWLDKIRIGLWLADMMLNKDFVLVERHFHIGDRIGQKDRCVHIVRSNDDQIGINFFGADTLAFHLLPACFLLTINNLHIVNVSTEFYFGHRLGCPTLANRYLDPDTGLTGGEFKLIREKTKLPIVKPLPQINHTSLFQACIPQELSDKPEFVEFLTSPHGSELFERFGLKSRVINSHGKLAFSDEPTPLGLCEASSCSREHLNDVLGEQVLKIQSAGLEKGPSFHLLSSDARKHCNTLKRGALKYNRTLLQALSNQIRKRERNSRHFSRDGIN